MDISSVYKKIDILDDEMLKLFIERMNLMKDIAEYKNLNHIPLVDRAREREILSNVISKTSNLGGAMNEYAFYFFEKLNALANSRQNDFLAFDTKVKSLIENSTAGITQTFPKTGTVACSGIEGSNAQAACDKLLPMGKIMYVNSFKAVCDAVGLGLCQYGVLPIENSSNGSVRAVYELMTERKFFIVRSLQLFIRHCLLVKPGVKLKDIKAIYSHPQALGQCSEFLNSLKENQNVKIMPFENTATAAKLVSESNDYEIAAISSPDCAEIYCLECIKDEIQDSDNNYTKFICISKEPVIYAGSTHISLIVGCGNTPGALNDILSKFSAHGVNMNKLESCPVVGRHFEYMFFMEIEASVQDSGIVPMLEDLERTCPNFVFLGNYALL